MLRKAIASQVESITHMPSDWGDKTVITAHKMQSTRLPGWWGCKMKYLQITFKKNNIKE